MLNSSSIELYWKNLESKKQPPKYVKKVSIIDFNKLKNSVDSKNEIFVKNLARKMYDGEAFIIRKAASKSLKKVEHQNYRKKNVL